VSCRSSSQAASSSRSTGSALFREVRGASGPPILFLHPLPHDLTSWTYQTARYSAFARTIAVDLPGHGRSPRAAAGLTLRSVAGECWEAAEDVARAEGIVVIGCSVGAVVAKHMVGLRPDRVRALVLTGGGLSDGPKGILARHEDAYRDHGLAHKREHLAANFSAAFRETDPARWSIDVAMERNASGDVEGTLALMRALDPADPPGLHDWTAPTLIVTGSEDRSRERQEALHHRLSGSELAVIEGAGHCCQIERPLEYDGHVLRFLRAQGVLG
jgi:pimeloyl-ACP methyl ester carboxylesterase